MSKETLYINNLNEKPSINTTRRALQTLFEKYGEILSLIVKKKVSLKGQLFITYKNIESSRKAQRELNGTQMLGKQMSVNFAKDNSIALQKDKLSEEEFKEYLNMRLKKRKLLDSEDIPVKKQKKIKLIKSDTANNVLLLQNLSSGITKDEIVSYFSKFDGFIDLRLIKLKKLSFVEFSDITSASKLMKLYPDGLIKEFVNDDNDPCFITFAK